MIPKFDPKELNVVGETVAYVYMPSIKIYDYPVTEKEAITSMFKGKAYWQMVGAERCPFVPRLLPDNTVRGLVFEHQPFDVLTEAGGKDMFGIEWEYIAQVGGSTVRPGVPFLEDISQWREKIVWPDIDSWDWEGSAKINNDTYLASDKFNLAWFQTGWFERLIALMDFEGALMAIFDEDSKEEVKAFFEKLTDLYIRIFDKYITYFPKVDGFFVHDDWGSQKETFFSPELVAEMIVPYMKRVTDFLHVKGKCCELHSCGQILKQVPNIIAAGWDAWNPQLINDMDAIYDLYGDKIVLGIAPEPFDIESATEEEQRAAARAYADKYCRPDKPTYLNMYSTAFLTPAYREELYIRSRENYSK
ncbi:MAG: methyltransferase [Oscillospiraceae bacterium]|nr:methyltransferase [Oscillospiraceae bacterium]